MSGLKLVPLSDMELTAFLLLVLSNCIKSDVFTFIRNGNLSFPNKYLQNHVLEKYNTKFQVIQCAMECFRTQQCKSFNFGSNISVCELNDATHEEFPKDLFPDVSGHQIQYHVREAFFIESGAVGPCGAYPCKNQARCLDTKSIDGHRMYICHCSEGWKGKNCDVKEEEAMEWAAWEDWGTCSVSCGYGYQTRRRQCIDVTNGSPHPATKCYGRDIEYQACAYKECPRWGEWSVWSDCSTYTTCGRGYRLRHRNCSNGGVAGVDRYCKGPSNESSVCDGISCKGMVRLVDGPLFGEGRVEMYNNVNQSWLILCGDTWSLSKADIVCKQAGYMAAFKAITDGRYDTTLYDGAERVIINCSSGGEVTIHQCVRSKMNCSLNAGVQCKVQGAWSLWAPWGDCSVMCANGTRTRTRDCNHPPPNHGGTACPGINTEYTACNLPLCPIDGVWTMWTDWSECSVSCANGTQFRSRICIGPLYGGKNCTGPNEEVIECFPKTCPVDGVWTMWTDWSECSVSCANGTQYRARQCIGPFYDGKNCTGPNEEVIDCFSKTCPVDGVWDVWSNWEECNVTCGGGGQNRYRGCHGPFFDGAPCEGNSSESRDCNIQSCPIDGIWYEWSNWTECTQTCGSGVQSRNRTCEGPYHGGQNCSGDGGEVRECNTQYCPVDGYWETWSNWTNCNVSCGGGNQRRMRMCEQPKHGGEDCHGDDMESITCNNHSCPIDGNWNPWAEWTMCTLTCGNGTRTRNRTCQGPFYNGLDCVGNMTEIEDCNSFSCPVDGIWGSWSKWEECNVTCGGGGQSRNRDCHGPFSDGAPCEGNSSESRECNMHFCPIDGYWETWSNWTNCNVSCGSGNQWRTRMCEQPKHGGEDCHGDDMESVICNNHSCPIAGIWGEWSEWKACSVQCGRGKKIRSRTCIGTEGSTPCVGQSEESRFCNPSFCPVDGIWLSWGTWSSCDVTCGKGTRYKERTCDGPYDGGQHCSGTRKEDEVCNPGECPD